MNDCDRIFSQAASLHNASFYGPANHQLVEQAEKVLGLQFPPSYREFLLRLGCGGVGSAEFYGLIGANFENSAVPDAVWITLTHRRECNLPQTLIIVSDTGDGGYYCIDISIAAADGENPIVEWWPVLSDTTKPLPVVAQDFAEFFREKALRAMP